MYKREIVSVTTKNIVLFFLTLISISVFLVRIVDLVSTACISGTIKNINYSVLSVNVVTVERTYTTTNYFLIPIIIAFFYNTYIIIKKLIYNRKEDI